MIFAELIKSQLQERAGRVRPIAHAVFKSEIINCYYLVLGKQYRQHFTRLLHVRKNARFDKVDPTRDGNFGAAGGLGQQQKFLTHVKANERSRRTNATIRTLSGWQCRQMASAQRLMPCTNFTARAALLIEGGAAFGATVKTLCVGVLRTGATRKILQKFLSANQLKVAGKQRTVDVRFTPNSGHVQCNSACPLCANSGHPIIHSITPSRWRAVEDEFEAKRLGRIEVDCFCDFLVKGDGL